VPPANDHVQNYPVSDRFAKLFTVTSFTALIDDPNPLAQCDFRAKSLHDTHVFSTVAIFNS
jgi:hypothetical protein